MFSKKRREKKERNQNSYDDRNTYIKILSQIHINQGRWKPLQSGWAIQLTAKVGAHPAPTSLWILWPRVLVSGPMSNWVCCLRFSGSLKMRSSADWFCINLFHSMLQKGGKNCEYQECSHEDDQNYSPKILRRNKHLISFIN